MAGMATIAGAHHVALTVRDADRSAAWYADLLGMQELFRLDEDDVKLRVLAHPDSGWIMGVRQYPNRPDGPFDEQRTGLDHLAFTVTSRPELEAWESELARRGIAYSPIRESPIGTLITFRDPDNIQLELWLPLGS
jgi:glyoxylase I family protein